MAEPTQMRPANRHRRKGGEARPSAPRVTPSGPAPVKLHVEYVPIDSVHPDEANPRLMPEEEFEKLSRCIASFGQLQPLIVRRSDGRVIGGHQRLAVAKRLGHTHVAVVYVELNDAEARALNLALNRIQGQWDLPRLGGLLEELRDLPDFDETLSGFDPREIEEILTDLERDQLPAPYEETFLAAAEQLQAQRLGAPTRVQSGQVWHLGRQRLFCGDALVAGQLETLLAGEKVDHLLSDPPYGVGFQSTLAGRGRRKEPIANDEVEGFEDFLALALPALKVVLKPGGIVHLFAGGGGPEPVLAKAMLAVAEHFSLLNVIVWDKLDPGLGWRWRRSWEAILEASLGKPAVWNGGTGKRNVLRFPKAIPQSDQHPTPKPVPLLEELIRACSPTQGLVLDPFAGSGSTLIAAERTGRTCLAVELEPRYCDITLARWESLTQGRATCEGVDG
jgi:DNA modification methylase